MVEQSAHRKKYLLFLFIFGIVLINNISCTKNPNSILKKRLESSPQFNNGKFHNNIEGLYDAGAAWRASFKELFLGSKEDHVPDQQPPIQQFTEKDFYKHDYESVSKYLLE